MSDTVSSDLLENLLKDPFKRALVLQLLNKGKDDANKRTQVQKSKTPKRLYCESPTAMFRRRALEKMNQDSGSEGSSSESSEIPAELKGPQLPFGELLKGVIAYVEVKRNDEDRSEGIKSVIKLMGATVRDSFTRDVTHVIFKDGSFTTYQKARLLNKHLVSVLWLEAVRKNGCRVPEKRFPAFGVDVCNEKMSLFCSQIQREFEDIVKDEKRRRRTLYTSKVSNLLQTSTHSDDETSRRQAKSPELTSDDSDCEGVINGECTQKLDDVIEASLISDDESDKRSQPSSYSASLMSHVTTRKKPQTINIISNIEVAVPPPVTTVKKKKPPKEMKTPPSEERTWSKLLLDPQEKNSISNVSTSTDKTTSGLGSLKTSESKSNVDRASVTATGTTMSSLRLSESPKRKMTSSDERSGSKRSRSSVEKSKKNNGMRAASSGSDVQEPGNLRRSRRSLFSKSASSDENSRSVTPISENSNVPPTSSKKPKTQIPLKELIEGTENIKRNRRASSLMPTMHKTVDAKARRATSVLPNNLKNIVLPGEQNISQVLGKKEKRLNSNVANETVSSNSNSEKSERLNKQSSSLESDVSLNNSDDSSLRRKSSRIKKRRSRLLSSEDSNVQNKRDKAHSESEGSLDEMSISSPSKKLRGAEPKARKSDAKENKPINNKRRPERKKSKPTAASVLTESEDNASDNAQKNSTASEENSSEEATSSSRKSHFKSKKTRKLYNPNDLTILTQSQEEESKDVGTKAKKKNDVFLNPNYVALTTLLTKKHQSKSPELNLIDLSSDESSSKVVNRKKVTKKKQNRPKEINEDLDEQVELLAALDRSIEQRNRRSERLTLSEKKPKYVYSSCSSSTSSIVPISPLKRRSTLDFVNLSSTQMKRRLKLDPKRDASIVCTKMHRGEVLHFEQVVNKLGRFFVDEKVTARTTHLVAGESKRTINMLKAIARGCWILRHEWLQKCEEAGRWLDEEDYELTDFAPSVQQCRLQKEAFGPRYSTDIFKDCGYIYLGPRTNPKGYDLRELIYLCNGRVTSVYRNASISVGEHIHRHDVTCVTELWVLDCITWNKFLDPKKYLLK